MIPYQYHTHYPAIICLRDIYFFFNIRLYTGVLGVKGVLGCATFFSGMIRTPSTSEDPISKEILFHDVLCLFLKSASYRIPSCDLLAPRAPTKSNPWGNLRNLASDGCNSELQDSEDWLHIDGKWICHAHPFCSQIYRSVNLRWCRDCFDRASPCGGSSRGCGARSRSSRGHPQP